MSESTNTENKTCKRCKGSGMKGVKHGYLPCITCGGKGYRTSAEIAAHRQYMAEVADRQSYLPAVMAFGRTLPTELQRAVTMLSTLLCEAARAHAQGAELEPRAVEVIDGIRQRTGADMLAWLDAR